MGQEEKFRDKYRVSSARLQNYDYGQSGAYFVTICTQNRESFLGQITNGVMKLSEMGEIVKAEWEKTAVIRKNVILGERVVMPNHFHAVAIIDNGLIAANPHCILEPYRTVSHHVETHCNASLQHQPQYKNKFGPQSHNLASIIRGFKGAAVRQIHLAGFQNFVWQSRFYDHIIRNENELNRISEYIQQNPHNWNNDKFFLTS